MQNNLSGSLLKISRAGMKCNDEGLVTYFKQLWKELSELPPAQKNNLHYRSTFFIRMWQELFDNDKL